MVRQKPILKINQKIDNKKNFFQKNPMEFINKKQQISELEQEKNQTKEKEKWTKEISINSKNFVTRVLNKDSNVEEYENFYQASDLRNQPDNVEEKDVIKIDQNKTKKLIDTNDKFNYHFKSSQEFMTWFTPEKYKFVQDTFKKYKQKLVKKINLKSGTQKQKIINPDFEDKLEEFKELKAQKIMSEENNNEDKNEKMKRQLRVYKNNLIHKIRNGIKPKNNLSEENKREIISQFSHNIPIENISKSISRKYQTVYSFLQRFLKGGNSKMFAKQEINRRYFTKSQLTEIEKQIDDNFIVGDSPKTLINHIKSEYDINIGYHYAYSLLKEFGNKLVKVQKIQYDHTTKSWTLCRHLFSLYIVAQNIHSNISLQSVDEFGLFINRKSDKVFKKPRLSKKFKINEKQSFKYNIIVGCSENDGVLNWQISEKPQNSILQHEFILKFRDYIVDKDLDSGKDKNVLTDDASFHGWSQTMQLLEDSEDSIGHTHLSGGLSMINPSEQCINKIKAYYSQNPNQTKLEAVRALHNILPKMNKLDGQKIFRMAAHKWTWVSEDIYEMLNERMSLNSLY